MTTTEGTEAATELRQTAIDAASLGMLVTYESGHREGGHREVARIAHPEGNGWAVYAAAQDGMLKYGDSKSPRRRIALGSLTRHVFQHLAMVARIAHDGTRLGHRYLLKREG